MLTTSIASLLNYNCEQREQQKKNTQHTNNTPQIDMNEMREMVRVARINSHQQQIEQERFEKSQEKARRELPRLYNERSHTCAAIARLNDELNEAIDIMRHHMSLQLISLTTVRNGKLVAKPGNKYIVLYIKECLEDNRFDDEPLIFTAQNQLNALRGKLNSLNEKIDSHRQTLGQIKSRRQSPRQRRDECVMNLVPLLNYESMWTEENEADLSEYLVSLKSEVENLNEQVRPENGYPQCPHYYYGLFSGEKVPDKGTPTLDITHSRNVYNRLCERVTYLKETEGETDRVKKVSAHLARLYRRIEFMSIDRNIVKRGRKYYRLNPAPVGKRVSN